MRGGRVEPAGSSGAAGVREQPFRRWCRRYREAGEAGLRDRRVEQPAANRVPAEARATLATYRYSFLSTICQRRPEASTSLDSGGFVAKPRFLTLNLRT